MRSRRLPGAALALMLLGATLLLGAPAGATPVCTDGFMGGPPREVCGGRTFPEAAGTTAYVQFGANPSGFREYLHGVQFLAQAYPRWVSVFTVADRYRDARAVSPGGDLVRPDSAADGKDGRELIVIKLTDHQVPDAGKETLFFSLSIHGNERGALEGGVRTVEDLAMAAASGEGTIVDGMPNFTTATGRAPEFHTYPVGAVLRQEVVYFVDLNPDGWAVGDLTAVPSLPYERGNSIGTDLNRQMPTVGVVNPFRNPMEEPEARYGHRFMHEVAAAGQGGRMGFGGDIHGELNSSAYVDIMYPAGQFSPVQHRRHMAIAERTKSVIDATLYAGIINEIEEASGGNDARGEQVIIPTKPADWATVWDTLAYTDTGFVGDYLATDLAYTGLDYEIFLNHTIPDRGWTVYLQENHINATRAIVKTAMAYALTQRDDFNAGNVRIPTLGRPGYVFNPEVVTDTDGIGTPPGPGGDGKGANGLPVSQRPYRATPMRWFEDTGPLLEHPFRRVLTADVAAADPLDTLDSLVIADVAMPGDAEGRPVDRRAYFASLRAWVERGGNLILTDRALHALVDLGVVPEAEVYDLSVYLPHVDITDPTHPLVARLRENSRQLVEATLLGFTIAQDESPMTAVDASAFTAAGGHVVGTTGEGSDVTLGALSVGRGRIVILGGALPTPTEKNDHRFGLRDYALTYTATYILENALRWDAAGLGTSPLGGAGIPRGGSLPRTGAPFDPFALGLLLAASGVALARRRRQWAPRPNRTSRPGRAPVASPRS